MARHPSLYKGVVGEGVMVSAPRFVAPPWKGLGEEKAGWCLGPAIAAVESPGHVRVNLF